MHVKLHMIQWLLLKLSILVFALIGIWSVLPQKQLIKHQTEITSNLTLLEMFNAQQIPQNVNVTIKSVLFVNKINNTDEKDKAWMPDNTRYVKNVDLSKYDVPRLSHPGLPRIITAEEHKHIIKLLSEIDELFKDSGIPYTLTMGTLLGSYMCHDLLPWDDDLDLQTFVTDYERVLSLFKNTDRKYTHLTALDMKRSGQPSKIKIYSKLDPKAGIYRWNWPFADISFLILNDSHVGFSENLGLYLPISDVMPFHLRPFGGKWFPSLHNPGKLFEKRYGHFNCESHFWDHKKEVGQKQRQLDCKTLMSVYPFVKRTVMANGGITENLMVNKTSIYSIWTDEPYNVFGAQ